MNIQEASCHEVYFDWFFFLNFINRLHASISQQIMIATIIIVTSSNDHLPTLMYTCKLLRLILIHLSSIGSDYRTHILMLRHLRIDLIIYYSVFCCCFCCRFFCFVMQTSFTISSLLFSLSVYDRSVVILWIFHQTKSTALFIFVVNQPEL